LRCGRATRTWFLALAASGGRWLGVTSPYPADQLVEMELFQQKYPQHLEITFKGETTDCRPAPAEVVSKEGREKIKLSEREERERER
jgi:hypothetical protein